MGFLGSNFVRVLSFNIVTALEILLGLFLLFYGSELLKFFAVGLLIFEFFALQRLYIYITHSNRYLQF